MAIHVLVVEDDPQFAVVVKSFLQSEGMEVDVVRSASEVLERLLNSQVDAMLLDLMLGNDSGLNILRELNSSGSQVPIILMTAHASVETVAEAMHLNAFDYVSKPFSKKQIVQVVKSAVASSRGKGAKPEQGSTGRLFPIIGQSPKMVSVYKAIGRVSKTESTVLITGESGTGKELIARAIHDHSDRSGKPFIAVNCGAIAEALLESELFGHVKGAFTGAHAARRGILETASGGTVFFDEISETSSSFQVKLLRVLQQRTILPVGSSEERPIHIRVIAATNRSLEDLRSSSFRQDLLYRLSVIHIHIPALRDRVEDIPFLANHFRRKFNKRLKKSVVIPEQTMQWLQSRHWEGNVRELENGIERAVTMNATGEILPEDFTEFGLMSPDQTQSACVQPQQLEQSSTSSNPVDESPVSLNEITRQHILRVLKQTGGNKLRAAQILGVGRYSLYRMAARLGIKLADLNYDEPLHTVVEPTKKMAWVDEHLFDTVSDIIYTRDFQGVISSINAAGEKTFGCSRRELVGRTLHDFFQDPHMEEKLRATNEKLLQHGTDRSIVNFRDPSGRVWHLESIVSLVRDSLGQPIGARGIMRDVTEAKELEQQVMRQTAELQEANEKLKELGRIRADFAAMLVHDLKTPASTMMMTLEYLQDRFSEQAAEVRNLTAAGLASGQTIIRMVEDMLEIFRFESDRIELSCVEIAIEQMIEQPFQQALVQAQQKSVTLTCHVPPELPSVSVDPLKMARVLSNLLGNALKYTPSGGKIRLEAQLGQGSGFEEGKHFVQISIADNGHGIPSEHLPYIFDTYWRGERGFGTGLGLAIVKRIVSAHGGSVSVQSRVGIGSEFCFLLPALNHIKENS